MQDTLGTEGYRRAYQEKLAQVLDSEALDLSLTVPEIKKHGTKETLEHPRAIPQKQEGLYAVCYHPIGGCPKPEFFSRLYQAILPMEEVLLRVSPNESLYIINLTAEEARTILALTKDGARTYFETSVSCIGASICQIGARDSQGLLKACIERVRRENFPDHVLPKIYISGCPSSCSGHPIAALGFRGGVKQTPEGPKPAFAVYEMGCPLQGEEAFGTELGVMLEAEIPEFLAELGREINARGMVYNDFIQKCHEDFLNIAGRFL